VATRSPEIQGGKKELAAGHVASTGFLFCFVFIFFLKKSGSKFAPHGQPLA